jgi:hypothetical protein
VNVQPGGVDAPAAFAAHLACGVDEFEDDTNADKFHGPMVSFK